MVLPFSSSYEKDFPMLSGTTNDDIDKESMTSAWVDNALDHGLHLVSAGRVDD